MKTITPWLSSLLALGLLAVPNLHAPLGAQLATTSTLEADTAATSTALAPTTTTTPTLRVSRDTGNFDRLRFNFKSVPLDTVLDYLSREAGFVIIKSVSVEGTVDLVSHQPMTRTEAVALLNTVLNEKGYAAIRNDRTLTIVSRSDARQRDIPVHVGNAPETIPKSDEMVTQIIPIRYAKAEELIASIKDLLPSYATLSSNASSNAIVLTGTQTDIRRIAEIVRALDSSISSISTLRVFHLQFADSKETANLITSLFQSSSTSNRQNSNSNNPFARFRGGPFGGFGGGPGGDNNQNSQSTQPDSAALQAASHVVAAADERTNSVVVSAPDDLMDTVAQLITSIDNSTELNTEVRVFPLKFAAADQMAATITSVFAQNQSASVRGNQRGQGFIQSMVAATQQANTSQRKQTESTVLAQADTRTNSVIVSAVSDVMEQIAKVIEQLDQNPAKSKKVYVYSVRNADPKEVTSMLQKIFGSSATAGTSTRSSSSSSRTGTSSNQRNSNSNSNNSNSNSSSSNRSSSSSSMR